MPATKPQYTIQPQRGGRKGWQPCQPHEAQRFAVLRLTHFRANGKDYTSTRFAAQARTSVEAQALLEQLLAGNREPSRKKPKLGQRFSRTAEVTIITSGGRTIEEMLG